MSIKSKSAISTMEKTLKSKIEENKGLKAELSEVKDKLETKFHEIAGVVDKEVIRAKDALVSVLGDIKENVKSIKDKSIKLVSGGGKSKKSNKKNSKKNSKKSNKKNSKKNNKTHNKKSFSIW